jgi:hypothetical protein
MPLATAHSLGFDPLEGLGDEASSERARAPQVGYASPPNPVIDYQACSDLQKFTSPTPTIVRQPNTATVNVFQELLNIFKS